MLLNAGVQRSVEAASANCEIAQLIAARLGLSAGVIQALGDVLERWDGGGVPGRASDEQIALSARMAVLVLDVELFRFRDDKIAEFWRFDADIALLAQLGMLPMMQAA